MHLGHACLQGADTLCTGSTQLLYCQHEQAKTTLTYACVHSGLCWWVLSPKRTVRRTLMPFLALQRRNGVCHIAL